MAKHGWVITKVIDKDRAAGTWGPSNTSLTKEEILQYGEPFRLLDGDGEVMAEGKCVHEGGEDCLSPLDDFGGANWGCTTVQYQVDGEGEWESVN